MPFFRKVWPTKFTFYVLVDDRDFVMALKRLAEMIIVFCLYT
jgi:hypothetical protein